MDIVEHSGTLTVVAANGVADDFDQAVAWLRANRDMIRAALIRTGSVMVRGLPCRATEEFARARDALLAEQTMYREKATPRSDLGYGVFSSTDMPAQHRIRLHNENSYTLEFPGLLIFGCLVAPETGGATAVADVREVLARLNPDVVARFREVGWNLVRTYHPHMSLDWTIAYGTTDRAIVEDYCDRNEIAYRWLAGGGLTTSQRRPATIRHPGTGEEVWFNHIAFWNEFTLAPETRAVLVSSYGRGGLPFNTTYGDGTPIDEDTVAELNRAYDAAERAEPWRPGDLLLVDNVLSCHGRQPFTGARKVVVAMGEPRLLVDCAPSVPAARGRWVMA